MKDERKIIIARVEPDLHQRVKVAAAKAGVSMADFLIDAVTAKMDAQEKNLQKN